MEARTNADDPVIGIDLGTTNSEVTIVTGGKPWVVEERGEAILPSCVGLDDTGAVIVGRQARNQYAAAPERTVLSVKRLMGSGTRVRMGDESYTPQEVSAFILKALKERADRALGRDVRKAVITVPAYFTDAQRQATREAGEIAGLNVVRIINEPTAAALSYESGGAERRTLLVYDMGGGTFDVSVVRIEEGVVEVLATAGDNQLGGDDFDALVLERLNTHIQRELGLENARDDILLQARLRRAAERAKIELSDQPYVRVEEDHVGSVAGEAMHLACELSRADFESDLEPFLDRSLQAVTTALQDADMRPSQLDRVLLVGGSTRIPRIAAVLTERLGQEPHGEVDPDLCVALGAGVQAGIETGQDMQAVLVDITPYTFGTSAAGELYGAPYMHEYVPLIRRNSKLPATRTEVFYTMFEDQEEVEIKVYQGEDPDALKNVEIGTFLFSGLNRRAGGPRAGSALHVQTRPRRPAARPRPGTGDRTRDPRRGRERHRAFHRRGPRRRPRAGLDPLGRGRRGGRSGRRRRGRRDGRRRRGTVSAAARRSRGRGRGCPRRPGAGRTGPRRRTRRRPGRDDQPDGGSPRRRQGRPRRAGGRAAARARRDPLLSGIVDCLEQQRGTLSDLRRPVCRRAVLSPLPDRPASGAGDRTGRGPSPPAGPRRARSRRPRGGPHLCRPSRRAPPVSRVPDHAGAGRAGGPRLPGCAPAVAGDSSGVRSG